VFRAKRVGRDKWRAVCPVHGGKYSGPLSIAKGHSGVIVKCFGGCETSDVLAVVGLKWADLFDGVPSPEVRARTSLWQMKEDLTVQWQSARMLAGLEKRNYWRAVEKRIRGELLAVRCRIEPEMVYREWRGEQWRLMNLTQREAAMEGAYERYTAANSFADGQNNVRPESLD
jgi:hypothetical protein